MSRAAFLLVFVACPLSALTARADFITFSAPGASNTYGYGINNAGVIVGAMTTGSNSEAAFIRDADGSFTSFLAFGSPDTVATGINDLGEIVGRFAIDGTEEAFVRDASGNFTAFAVPGATYTYAQGINGRGEVAGFYGGADGLQHFFIRDALGAFVTYDVPGFRGGTAGGINDAGQTVGGVEGYGFVRDATGNVTLFQAPTAGPYDSTVAYGINDLGVIAGSASGGYQGFVRDASGAITTYATPGFAGRFNGINDSNVVVGEYQDSSGFVHGFYGTPSTDNGGGVVAPEPAGWLTGCIGGVCLFVFSLTRRRKTQSA